MGFLNNEGLSYFWQLLKIKLESKKDKVLDKKIYQNIIATANNQAAGTFYFLKIRPDSFYTPCYVKFRIRVYINDDMTNSTKLNYNETTLSEWQIYGTNASYRNYNAIYSASYRPYYYLSAYRLTSAGYNAGLSNYIGVSIYSSTNATLATLKRDIEVELLEVSGGTYELLDEPVLASAFYSTTNYAGLTNSDAYTQGTRMSGDSNTIDRLNYASYQPLAQNAVYGTQLVLSADGVSYNSICTSRGTGTSKVCTTEGFLPEHILYYSNGNTVAKGSRLVAGYLYEALPFDFRYSCNCGTTLTAHKPVYLKCTYTDGLYYLATDGWYTQTLPTEADGYYYILVGYTYSTTSLYIKPYHPVFIYDGTNIREFVPGNEVVDALATQTGVVDIATAGGNKTGNVDFTFPKAFKEPPIITYGVRFSNDYAITYVTVQLKSLSATGGTFRWRNSHSSTSGTAYSGVVYYSAIGELADTE